MKIKNIVRVVILAPVLVYLLYCVYHFLSTEFKPAFLDCGVIVSKATDEIAIKNGSKTELYLNVQFEKSGFKSIDCEPTTYFKYKKGDNVCFNIEKDMGKWYNINNSVGLIVLVILTIMLVLFLLFYYLLPDSWFEY